jgi:hypothetical protein
MKMKIMLSMILSIFTIILMRENGIDIRVDLAILMTMVTALALYIFIFRDR